MRRLLGAIGLCSILLNLPVSAQPVPPSPPPPNHEIVPPGMQRPSADHPATEAGSIEGFVYWDASLITHKPAGSCRGLVFTISLGSPTPDGMSTMYTRLATLSDNSKYIGQVKEFLANGVIVVYDVCAYSYDQAPVGRPLEIAVTLPDPLLFSPYVAPKIPTVAPVQIISGKCNMLPNIMNPTASDLAAHWGSCQKMAYDVNFQLAPAAHILSSGGSQLSSGSSNQSGVLSGTHSQGMLATAGAGATQQRTPGTLLGIPQSSPRQGGGTPSPASKAELNPQPLPPRTQMTNADLLKMLKGGVPESVMLSAIRSSNHNFDFSPESCRELQAAHISRQVLDAMGDGSVRPCPTIQGNARQRTVKNAIVNLRAPKALKKMTNPRLAAQNAEILAVLQQQHQVAQQEAAAMKITVRPASTTASLTRVPATAGLNEGVPVQGVGPETVQDGRGSLSSSMTHAPGLNTTALTCSYNTTPRILQVSGGQSHGVFTPEAKYNLYTIVGCGFGQSQSGNSAFIFAANGFRANLNIDYWSDNGITAHLDPYLAGVLDQSNVTLVVAPAGAQQLEKSGFSFYAARGMPGPDGAPQEVQLGFDSMPQAYVSSQNSDPVLAGFNQVPSNAQSQFPSFSFQGTPVAAWVFRYAYGHWDPYSGVNSNECFLNDAGASIAQCQAYFDPTSTFKGGADTWDFSKLVPGFAISSYDLYYEDVDPSQLCGSWEDMEKKSGVTQNWDFNQSAAAQITVTWPIYWCENRELPPSDRKSEQKQSAYGLAVWVLGPRCVDPWSGQKDQSCMDEIRKMFS